jgi:hypothetical protein
MELNPSTIVGLSVATIGSVLYVIRNHKPRISRDYDLLFSSISLLCGSILVFQGWRLDPILLLCQTLSSATAVFFIVESLSLRSARFTNHTAVLFNHKCSVFGKSSSTNVISHPSLVFNVNTRSYYKDIILCAKCAILEPQQHNFKYVFPSEHLNESQHDIHNDMRTIIK